MNIRQANLNDIPTVNDLFTQSDNYHYQNEPYIYKESLSNSRTEEYIKGLITQRTNIFLVIEDLLEIVGFAFGYEESKGRLSIHNARTFLMIDNIVIDKKCRNNGYGRALMKEIIRIAKERKYSDIMLNVYSFNRSAIHLYEELGFKSISQDMILKL